jgi:hypothetical protein
VSGDSRQSDCTVFGDRRLDLVVFLALFLLMLVAARRLEVYSRMPADEDAGRVRSSQPHHP